MLMIKLPALCTFLMACSKISDGDVTAFASVENRLLNPVITPATKIIIAAAICVNLIRNCWILCCFLLCFSSIVDDSIFLLGDVDRIVIGA